MLVFGKIVLVEYLYLYKENEIRFGLEKLASFRR